jgi:hypothetical protein
MIASPKALITLLAAKDQVRRGLLDGTSKGIIGVGIDSRPNPHRLIVFAEDAPQAEKFINGIGAKDFSDVFRQTSAFLEFFRMENFVHHLQGFFPAPPADPITLTATSQVKPENGNSGRLGCFVKLANGSTAAITAAHLFHGRNSQKVSTGAAEVGQSKDIVHLKATEFNQADAALFVPSVDLVKNEDLSGGFVSAALVESTVNAKVTHLIGRSSSKDGTVLDTSAAVKIPIYSAPDAYEWYVFDGQILVDGSDFGIEKHSGSPVIMADDGPANTVKKGDVIGLYSSIVRSGQYHFITPIHACMAALGATAIHQP